MDISNSENIILKNILKDNSYLETCKPDFFKNESLGIMFQLAKEFWDKYHEMPSADQMVESFKISGRDDNIKSSEIHIIYDIDLNKYDEKWLKETTEFFIEYKTLIKSSIDSLKYIKSTPVTPDNIKDIIDTYKNIILDRNNINFSFDSGLDFFDPESHKQQNYMTFSSGYPFIDTVLGGGFSAKCLYVFLGQPKIGKTLWLGNLAAQSIKMGNNTAIVSFEMGDRKYIKRLGANLLGIPINEYGDFAENDINVKEKLKNITFSNLKVPGQLMIKQFPTSQVSVNEVEQYLKKIEEIKGIKFKTIMIDYINIMKNWRNPNSENTYMKIKQIAEDLRAMATNNDWAVISATQTKQSEFDSTDLHLNSASESSGLVATVDGMFGIIQDPVMYSNKQYKLKTLANRDEGYKNSYKIFNVDYKYMRILEDINDPIHEE